jgi:hypothetical protein
MIPINFIAVFVAAIASMIIGFIWYGPLFGKEWSKLMGWGDMTPEKMKEMQKKARPAYAITFVAALIMAYVLAHALLFVSLNMGTIGFFAGLSAGFWCWLGFVMPVSLGTVLWDQKPWKLWFINTGYWLVLLLVMGVILAIWPFSA